jgi:hypothetical protein
MNEELVMKQLENHEHRLDNHGIRLDSIEQRDAARDVQILNLCERISKLTTATYGLIGTIMATLFGFVLWYIQDLPH